jgi:transcription-repair coupling factor (superfamily II helicase)
MLAGLSREVQPGAQLSGLAGGAVAWALARLAEQADGPVVVLVPTRDGADRLLVELDALLPAGIPALRLPADDTLVWDGLSPHPEVPRERLVALRALDAGRRAVVVAPGRALLQKVLPVDVLDEFCVLIEPGLVFERDALVQALVERGYLATQRVDEPGTVAWRGEVLDLWPAGAPEPVRLEYFDDEIDALNGMNPETRRGTGPLDEVEVLPAREAVVTEAALQRAKGRTMAALDRMGAGHMRRRRLLKELKEGLWFPGAEDYLGALHPVVPLHERLAALPPGRLFVVDPRELAPELERFHAQQLRRWEELPTSERPVVLPEDRFIGPEAALAGVAGGVELGAMLIAHRDGPEPVDFSCRENTALRVGKGELAPAIRQLRDWLDQGWRVALVAESATRLERVTALFSPHGLPPHRVDVGQFLPGRLAGWVAPLDKGFHSENDALAVVSVDEIFGARARSRRRKTVKDAALSGADLAQLKDGDLVVHVRHGIGTFHGLKRIAMPIGGELMDQDFAELSYRGGDRLYLPVTRLAELYKYRATGNKVPRLDKLGGLSWSKRKSKVRDRVANLATQLLRIYALRELVEGHAITDLPPAYIQFEQTFPFVETPDQARTIEEVREDLAAPKPMDRLIIGDVGFGKTEVAMRAAMLVVLDGRQVALLCPTTVLAYQHWRTFSERFEGTGAEIALLSSFQSPTESRRIKQRLKEGLVDIVVGTQALLGRSVKFKELGLVVVDEEHRFGVKQKEKLKKLTQAWSETPCDYLAMSATPIPRTLHMALSGIRQVSLIATPPEGRRPVQTRVMRWDEVRIRQEILHELQRGGQVFFVHNRVQSIDAIATRLREAVPEASFAVAHGQMDPGRLEDTLLAFVRRDFHVLVCTTIIESGIDMPTVNTILVNRADQLGLAQLYQLRGRVGRGLTRGYCTLIVPQDDAQVTAHALKRLRVLQDHQELGAGMQIATADMELRGSGDLLGDSQHGQIAAVGLDTYIELLDEAIADARGDLARKRIEPELEIPVPAMLPESWVDDVGERLTEYRRLAACQTVAEVRDLISRWEDTYGEPPPEVLNLGWMAETRVRCRELGIERVSWLRVRVVLDFHPTTTVPPERVARVLREHPDRFKVSDAAHGKVPDAEPGHRILVRFEEDEAQYPFRFLHWVLRQFEKVDE